MPSSWFVITLFLKKPVKKAWPKNISMANSMTGNYKSRQYVKNTSRFEIQGLGV